MEAGVRRANHLVIAAVYETAGPTAIKRAGLRHPGHTAASPVPALNTKVTHHIETPGLQDFSWPRRLAPGEFRLVEAEFDQMFELGTIRHSNGP